MEYTVNELLERTAMKVARSVLRGRWQSDLLSPPDFVITMILCSLGFFL